MKKIILLLVVLNNSAITEWQHEDLVNLSTDEAVCA
jgi:hypothetical protein